MSTRKWYDVVVVGCGASGIAALSRLHLAGLNVLGLEASSRLGGRVFTTEFGNGKIEEGAEWVHGEDDNVVFALSQKYNVFEPTAWRFEFVRSNGERVDDKLGMDLFQVCMDITYSVGDHVGTDLQSMADHFALKYPVKLKKAGITVGSELQSEFMDWYHKQENVIDGSDDWSNTSLKGLAQYKVCDGNPVISWGHNGYNTIIDILLKKFPDPENALEIPILKNHIVEKINWANAAKGIEIICSNGSAFYCKSTVITVSLGVLKENHEKLFNPLLPEEKIDCIKGISFGTVDKIFLHYETNWWGEAHWFGLLWSEKEKSEIAEGHEWTTGLFCLSIPNAQPNVLCSWISGVAARDMEVLPIDIVQQKVEEVIQMFLGKLYTIPAAKGIHRSTWNANPFTRGSYSYHGMDCDRYNATTDGLKNPILCDGGKPRIVFAGEATSDHYFSTVHGAVQSGYREADRLIKAWAPYLIENNIP